MTEQGPRDLGGVVIVHDQYMRHIIFSLEEEPARVQVHSGASGGKMLQHRLQQCVGKLGVVDGARQQQCADHRGHGNERVFVRARLPPVGRLASNDIDHLLDAARGRAPYFGALAWHLRTERRNRTAHLDRKSTRLNSSHSQISYAVFCLKKKKTNKRHRDPTDYIPLLEYFAPITTYI